MEITKKCDRYKIKFKNLEELGMLYRELPLCFSSKSKISSILSTLFPFPLPLLSLKIHTRRVNASWHFIYFCCCSDAFARRYLKSETEIQFFDILFLCSCGIFCNFSALKCYPLMHYVVTC